MDIPASPPSFSFPRITRRRRHTNAGQTPSSPQQPPTNATPVNQQQHPSSSNSQAPPSQSHNIDSPRSFRIRLVPHLDSNRALHFDPIIRDVKVGGAPLRVGRFTDRATNPSRGNGLNPNDRNSDKVAFRSKVVSRAHAELWVEDSGKFFLKDTKSSSGTFINHMRLSPPGQESLAHLLKDGDVIQLGVDYQGGTEEMYRCVKIKVEVGQGREWQGGANAFNTAALKQLRTLQAGDSDPKARTVGDCCICLFSVGVCQSLFIAPCSHAFHYKCIRPMLELHHPGFSCPLCRTFADLEADVEVEPYPHIEEEAAEPAASSNRPNASRSPPSAPYVVDSDNDAVMNSPGGDSRLRPTRADGAVTSQIPRRGFIPHPSSIPHAQISVPNPADDDAQVENALLGYQIGEDEDAMALGDVLEAAGPGEHEFGVLDGNSSRHLMDTTVRPVLGSGTGSSSSVARPIPLRLDASHRTSEQSESDREREARDFADAATPLNNTFITMANSLLSAVQQQQPAASSSSRPAVASQSLAAAHAEDEDDVELELDEGTDRDEANHPSRDQGLSSEGSHAPSNSGIEVTGGGGGASSAATTPPGRVSIIGPNGAKRKRSL
ncbi:hypothetical protein FRC02_009770 [Tulasnella sp. 418]|nr:hypothetical protein FRC02_009770 [Tulasnella sp. 418]